MTIDQIERATAWIKERNAVPVNTRLLQMLGLTRARLSQLTTSGEIESCKVERTVYIPKADVAKLKYKPGVGRPRSGEKK